MRGRRSSLKIVLSEESRRQLEHLVRSTSVLAGIARRARIVLELAAGARLVEIAERTGVTEQVVRSWGSSPLDDQRLGAGILWAAGEVVGVVALGIVLYQWMRHEERLGARLDRQLDRRLDAERVALRPPN